MSSLTPPDPISLTLSSPALSLSSETLLRHEVSSLPPGQASGLLQAHVQYFREHFLDLNAEEMGRGLVVGVASSAQILSLLLSHSPMTLWSGRSKVIAMASLRSLVEVVDQAMLALGREATPTNHTLQVSVLLLLSRCCEVLTRLHQQTLPTGATPPAWPLHWTEASPTQHLLPKQWRGVAFPQHPAARFLLVSRGI